MAQQPKKPEARMRFADLLKTVAIGIPVASAAMWGLDQLRLRPVVTLELDRLGTKIEQQGLYMERQRLIDRKKDGTISEYERGILFGICRALKIQIVTCDKEDG